MTLKLPTFILGCIFIFSPVQSLKASSSREFEELKSERKQAKATSSNHNDAKEEERTWTGMATTMTKNLLGMFLGEPKKPSSKRIISPSTLGAAELILILAAGTRIEAINNGVSKLETEKYNKIYFPALKMVVGFKMMETGRLDTLKGLLSFWKFELPLRGKNVKNSHREKIDQVKKYLLVKGRKDLKNLTQEALMEGDNAFRNFQADIEAEGIKVNAVRVIDEDKPTDTLAKTLEGNRQSRTSVYGIYEIYVNGVRFEEGLSFRLAFFVLNSIK